MTLQYVYALQNAADIFEYFGHHAKAKKYDLLKKSIQQATMETCFHKASGLIAETPNQKLYSQHTNIWAILTNTVPEEQQPQLMEKILDEEHLIQSTIYFKFYLFRALQKAGFGERYLEMLDPWKRMLNKGMTTFGEKDLNPRSECHGWSASPCFDLLHTIAGIYPESPGFETVTIQPNPGELNEMEVDFPHPKGMIHLSLYRNGKRGIHGIIELPLKLTGTFVWENQRMVLKEGQNEIKFYSE